jgi:transposase, IS6 family
MDTSSPFKWRHFQADIMLLCVHWYLRYYSLSYRDLEEIMLGRGLHIDHTTVYRSCTTLCSRTGETRPSPSQSYNRFMARGRNECEGEEGVDVPLPSSGLGIRNTLEFLLSETRDAQAVKRFFQKTLETSQIVTPRIITVDKNAAYPKAFRELKAEGIMPVSCKLRQSKYLNKLVEQDHRARQTTG